MGFASTYPLVYYYLGYLAEQRGRPKEATEYFAQGAKMPPDYCFPFRLETVPVLEAALRSDPSDARALYYLGNLLFEIQPERAMECWGKSKELDDRFATVHRNLGWGHYRFRNDIAKAISGYEEAIACDNRDPRLLLELDALYEFGNVAPERRLAALEKNHETVLKRKESLIREIAVLVLCGKYDKAIDYLAGNFFHVREGGGEIHDIYVDAHLLKGLQCLATKQSAEALGHFRKASEYPENLSVGRPKNDRRAPQVEYYIGVALEALGDGAAARQSFQLAADQADTGEWPETQFYQALCWEKLGVKEKATAVFDRLIELGRRGVEQGEPADFFAKFGEQETRQARRASAHYTLGLGLLGKGDPEQAKQQFEQAVKLNVGHVWALQQLSQF
jgi:tetratricopeptide (TPR) repeat protein